MGKIDMACIIDDDPISVFSVKKAMEIANACKSIMTFHNGKDAYDKLQAVFIAGKQLPDVILLDLNMPVWDGWQFLDEFIKIPLEKRIEIYILSSSVDPADIEKAKSYEQISNFIIKPISIEKLQQIISE